jgi:hypothetical protein
MNPELQNINFEECQEETYKIDVSDAELEKIFENAVGRFEIDGDLVTRFMPECSGKAAVPMFLASKWGQFYEDRYSVNGGTHGIMFEGRRLLAPYMNLANRRNRRALPENLAHMMRRGYPAPNWCLEVEWETEAVRDRKGFPKVNEMFGLFGANETQIEEIWLLVYPQDDLKSLQAPVPPNSLPIVPRTAGRPLAGSKYFAIFIRNLDLTTGNQYVDDEERPLLVGYYLIEPNMLFRVPAGSLLYGAPDVNTNQLLDAMGYVIQQNNAQNL